MANSTLGNSITNTTGSVRFLCPKCNEQEIVRSRNERETVAKYTCVKCGFIGPN
ncbi:TPA: RNA-binding protein [Candidatus Woesearchaeota archaeon]|nr:RNA-binding protein [Candidatus Woesearchaeota archaeon]